MTISTEINATSCRDLISAVGGPFRPGDQIRRMLLIVAERAGLAPRVVRAAWAGDRVSRETLQRLEEARARYEAFNAAQAIEALAASMERAGAGRHREEIAALRAAVGALRGLDLSRAD